MTTINVNAYHCDVCNSSDFGIDLTEHIDANDEIDKVKCDVYCKNCQKMVISFTQHGKEETE